MNINAVSNYHCRCRGKTTLNTEHRFAFEIIDAYSIFHLSHFVYKYYAVAERPLNTRHILLHRFNVDSDVT